MTHFSRIGINKAFAQSGQNQRLSTRRPGRFRHLSLHDTEHVPTYNELKLFPHLQQSRRFEVIRMPHNPSHTARPKPHNDGRTPRPYHHTLYESSPHDFRSACFRKNSFEPSALMPLIGFGTTGTGREEADFTANLEGFKESSTISAYSLDGSFLD